MWWLHHSLFTLFLKIFLWQAIQYTSKIQNCLWDVIILWCSVNKFLLEDFCGIHYEHRILCFTCNDWFLKNSHCQNIVFIYTWRAHKWLKNFYSKDEVSALSKVGYSYSVGHRLPLKSMVCWRDNSSLQ